MTNPPPLFEERIQNAEDRIQNKKPKILEYRRQKAVDRIKNQTRNNKDQNAADIIRSEKIETSTQSRKPESTKKGISDRIYRINMIKMIFIICF
jgi:hypothetical protein